MKVTDIFSMDETKAPGLWKGTGSKLGKKKYSTFDYGAVIVLFMICIGLFAVVLKEAGYRGPREGSTLEADRQVSTEVSGSSGQAGIFEKIIQTVEEMTAGQKAAEEAAATIAVTGNGAAAGENACEEGVSEVTEPEFYEFTASDSSYFDDALFIGDSRTMGLKLYGTLDNASYFASSGLNLYTIDGVKVKETDELGEEIEVTLEQMLTERSYGKIYVMLGINELGYNFDRTVEKYQEFIAYLQEKQPDAILYVCANLHVNSLRNEVDEVHNNAAINRINEVIASFADQKEIFYLDVNPLFDDENGNLAEEYISDDSHLTGIYYETWCDWYCENTIVKESAVVKENSVIK